MSIDWDGYEPYDPGVSEPLRSLPRVEALRVFKDCMEFKPARLKVLRQLLKANGVELSTADSSIQDLNDWFLANVETHPEQSGRLLSIWYSVCHDIALFLGEVMIERHPNLRWEFFTWGKSNVAFQRHVIMGFSTEDPKFHTNIDVDRSVSNYAHRIVESRGSVPSYGTVVVRGAEIDVDAVVDPHRAREIVADAFWRWLQTAAQRA